MNHGARAAWLIALWLNGAHPADAGPSFPLAMADRLMIEKGLGKGVVGQALAAPTLDEPARYFVQTAKTLYFEVVNGADAGKKERHRFTPLPQSRNSFNWKQEAGDEEVIFLKIDERGNLVATGIEDGKDVALTEYAPPEPYLLKGMHPGETRQMQMGVRVYDLKQPDELNHEGTLSVTHAYIGAYRLSLPAGAYDAILTKSTFSGNIGPASVRDTQYRFFAPQIGIVALVEERDVTAFVVYRTHDEVGKLLTGVLK